MSHLRHAYPGCIVLHKCVKCWETCENSLVSYLYNPCNVLLNHSISKLYTSQTCLHLQIPFIFRKIPDRYTPLTIATPDHYKPFTIATPDRYNPLTVAPLTFLNQPRPGRSPPSENNNILMTAHSIVVL